VSELKITVNDAKDVPGKLAQIFDLVSRGIKGGPVVVTLGRETRTPAQNRRLWAVLRDVAGQVEWYGQKLCEEDWKHVFSSAIEKQQAVPGVNGGFVVLGVSTRGKSKPWFSDLFELINAFGAEHGVKWSDPALEAFDYYGEAQS
jgi:hypothetical protein